MSDILFLDTNIYLHYQPFEQIDWAILVNSKMLTIVIPPITLRELNKAKELHQHSHIRNRASRILKTLTVLFPQNTYVFLRENLQVQLEDRDPLINFEEYQLDKRIQDDQLIASMLMCRNENPEKVIRLVASDYGLNLILKAGRQKFETLKMPENFKIPEQPNETQKEIAKLKREVLELKSRIPKISLSFNDGQNYNAFELLEPIDVSSEDISINLEKIKGKYPKREMSNQKDQSTEFDDNQDVKSILSHISIQGLYPQSEYDRYNNELDVFYDKFKNYLIQKIRYKNLIRRIIRLDIMIDNTGTAPANDIDVVMHFPDGFLIWEKEDFPETPSPPRPPIEPRTQIEMLTGGMNQFLDLQFIDSNIDIGPIEPPSNISDFDIQRTNSYQIKLHVNCVKHNYPEFFEPLFIVFSSHEKAMSFKIDYQLFAANIPSEVSDSLHVKVSKKPR